MLMFLVTYIAYSTSSELQQQSNHNEELMRETERERKEEIKKERRKEWK